MKKVMNNREFITNDAFVNEKISKELRAQPRKSYQKKNAVIYGNFYDEDEGRRHHLQRSEPGKNIARMQLRRLENLY